MDTARREPSTGALGPAGAQRTSRPVGFLTAGLAVCLVLLFALSLVFASDPSGRWMRGGPASVHPSLPQDLAAAPLATPAPAPSGTGGFKLLEYQDDGSGVPVRWDPCRPVHYVVRSQGLRPEATGDRTGGTGDRAGHGSALHLRRGHDRAAHRQPPRPEPRALRESLGAGAGRLDRSGRVPAHEGFAGLAGPDAVSGTSPGERRYVSGVVYLNREHLGEVATWSDGRDRIDAVVLHEFGHLVGLDTWRTRGS